MDDNTEQLKQILLKYRQPSDEERTKLAQYIQSPLLGVVPQEPTDDYFKTMQLNPEIADTSKIAALHRLSNNPIGPLSPEKIEQIKRIANQRLSEESR